MDERVPRQPAGEPEYGEMVRDLLPAPGGEGGDPVCWLHRVCPECGAFAESPPPTDCHRCGTRVGD